MNHHFFIDHVAYRRVMEDVDKSVVERLAQLAVYNRINTLSCINRVGRGWLGASLSCADVLTALYFHPEAVIAPEDEGRDYILLSKGHAAVMQYAALAGQGIMSVEDLLLYNRQDGPQAHTDLRTRGIEANSGSLGQTLSKANGLALAGARQVFVIMGDGELQEGQNYEAMMMLHQYRLKQVVPIIDVNGIQSDSNVRDVKALADMVKMLQGFGLAVLEIDGQNMAEVVRAYEAARHTDAPVCIVAHTKKAAGVSFMESDATSRRAFAWHGSALPAADYGNALNELLEKIEDSKVREALTAYLAGEERAVDAKAPAARIGEATGEAFTRGLEALLPAFPALRVLDADLEKPCRLTGLAKRHPEVMIECGIAEQDMTSCAGGMALRGRLPVVNTYASFYRRAFEQVYINATEHTRIIYAGHYAGLCYFSDGKTHQCTGDIAMMRSIPGMQVFYPATPQETEEILRWYVSGTQANPMYIRLHRTPRVLDVDVPFTFGEGICLLDQKADTCYLTSGPHMSAFCLDAARKDGADVYAISTLRGIKKSFVRMLMTRYSRWIVREELYEAGGLLDELTAVAHCVYNEGDVACWPRTQHQAVNDFTFSTLEPDGLYRHFGMI